MRKHAWFVLLLALTWWLGKATAQAEKRSTTLLEMRDAPANSARVGLEPEVLDFRYSPHEWQVMINPPDDPSKSIVAWDGGLYYDFGKAILGASIPDPQKGSGRFQSLVGDDYPWNDTLFARAKKFETRVLAELKAEGEGSKIRQQWLEPRIPIIITEQDKGSLTLHQEAWAAAFDRDQSAYAVEYAFNRDRQNQRHIAYPTHDFIANFVWDFPTGRGRRFAANSNKVVNALIGNWTFVGSFSRRSGWFFTPLLQGVDPGNLGKTSNRLPDLVPGCDPYAGGQSLNGLWFNPACYTTPAAGQLGNVVMNSLEGPSAWVFNLNPFKEFPLSFIREGTKIRVGANIYNILNNGVFFGTPIANLNSAVAGKLTASSFINARGYSHDYAGMRAFVFDMRIIF